MNRGEHLLGWDTDQFPNDLGELSLLVARIVQAGGFTTGGFNFDAKVRRQSFDAEDLFHAHVGGMDILAHALLVADRILTDGKLPALWTRATPAGSKGWARRSWTASSRSPRSPTGSPQATSIPSPLGTTGDAGESGQPYL